jgi:predicted metallopeptidase
MSQILDALSKIDSQRLVCSYRNNSESIQIARITNIPNWYFERVVFPQEYLLFEATPSARLEIYQEDEPEAVKLVTKILCDRLCISEPEPLPI